MKDDPYRRTPSRQSLRSPLRAPRPSQARKARSEAAEIVSNSGRRLDAASAAILGLTTLITLVAFLWPLLVTPSAALDGNSLSPFVFAALLPLVIGIVVSQLSRGTIDPKSLAMLGVLAALGTLTRPLGAGTAGIEFTFVPLILGGRVFGPVFGFLLGSTTMLTSAMLTGGVGPWLPFQMLAASFVSMGAGLLPRRPRGGWAEIALLGLYGSVTAFLYGWLVDLSFWPFNVGLATELSYVAGASLRENLHRFLLFNLATSMAWNVGRAVTTVVTLALVGRPLLRILRRTNRKATFAPG